MHIKIFKRQPNETENELNNRAQIFSENVFASEVIEMAEDTAEGVSALVVVAYQDRPQPLNSYKPNIETRGKEK